MATDSDWSGPPLGDPESRPKQGALYKGWLGVTLAWRHDLSPLLGADGFLYASSANVTGDTPAVTASQVAAAFGEKMRILFDDAELPGQRKARPGVIVRVLNGPSIELVRSGIQNETSGLDAEAYLEQLHVKWRNRETSQSHR